MESLPVVLDISSDEELGLEEGPKSFNYKWIKEFLGVSDKESDNSDEVVVVREVQPERKSKSSRAPPAAIDLDDDCVVLDGDPEKRLTSVNESATESDELLIVGEKGQIACRDYPHSRHICATYPFSSTPHERHCEKCHCYVCDLPAPCLEWGTGILSTDHCHATEKAEMWKTQRKNFKMMKGAPLPASTNFGNSPHVGHPQYSQVLPLGIGRLSSNSISQNQASRLTTMRTCSSSLNSTLLNQVTRANTIPICSSNTNLTVPNGINNSRCHESVSTFIRNRYQPHLVSRQLLSVRDTFQRDTRGGGSSLGPQFSPFHLMSKGVGGVGGTVSVNHSAHGSSGYSNHVNPTQPYDKYHDATGLSNERACNVWNNAWCPTNLSSYPHTSLAQPSLNCFGGNPVASETQAYSQPSHLENSQNFNLSCMRGNNAPSRYVACQSSNWHGTEHQRGSQIENASGNIIPCRNSSQDVSHQEPLEENQGETARKEDFSLSDFDLIWNEDASQSIEPLVESPHIQSTGSINQASNLKESDNLLAGTTNLSSLVDLENWLMEKDVALPSELNIPSPDSIPVVETGTLFCDFDTSWNGLTHA